MKRTITQLLMLVCIVLCSSMSVNAQAVAQRKDVKERIAHRGKKSGNLSLPEVKKEIAKAAARANKQAEQQPALSRVRARAEERTDVVLLDSIKDDEYCVHYGYNELGWLVSEKYYNIEEGVKVFDTEDSYFLEYEFDEQGRCTRYAQFLYNADETKGAEMQRVVVTWKGGNERTEEYFALAEDLGVLYPTASVSYDKYGNYSLMIFYDWDDDTQQAFVEEYWEMKFKGNVMEYYYDEEGNPDGMDFNEDLFERLCYYYLDYNHRGYDDEAYYTLSGYKTDEVVDGLTITRTYYEVELDESEGDVIDFAQLDSYWGTFEWEEVITLTPSRNRYASHYWYEPVFEEEESDEIADDVVPEENKPATRAAAEIEKVLDWCYAFEWDEFERLVKWESYEGEYKTTYTCSYHNDKYNEFTFEEYDVNMHDDEGIMGETYGEVYKERFEVFDYYLERVTDEYDTEGRVLHRWMNEVYYSDEEMGKDMNGDGIISTERETDKEEAWYTYDADSKSYSEISCDDDAEYWKYDTVDEMDEKNDGQYLKGYREYKGESKDGPWTLTYENMNVYRVDAMGNIYQMPIAQWCRSYDVDSQTWWGYKYEINDGIITKEYTVDSQTGEFIDPSVTDTPPSDELQEGELKIDFVENGWEYNGYQYAAYQWDEDLQKEVLKVVDGWMEIRWVGGSGYLAENPVENYKFPVGLYFEGLDMAVSEDLNEVKYLNVSWNSEENKWMMTWEEGTFAGTTYITNENGQVVEEYNTYTFDGESGRMVLIPDAVVQTIYSFDDQGRLSTIEDGEMVLYYTYLEGYDYLLEAYALNKATNEKVYSCKYFYSNGSYTPPVTQIEKTEAALETVTISGASVIAEGLITLYNAEGQVVARGNGIVTAPQSGLYIVAVGQERIKVCIK